MRYKIVRDDNTPSEPEVELYLREYSSWLPIQRTMHTVVQLLARHKGEGHFQAVALVTFDYDGKVQVSQENVFSKVGLRRVVLGT